MAPPGYPLSAAAADVASKQQRHTSQQHIAQGSAEGQSQILAHQPLKEVFQQIQSTLEALVALDLSLKALFETAPNTDVTEHQQLVQFRSRAARRISRYCWQIKVFSELIGRTGLEPRSKHSGTTEEKSDMTFLHVEELNTALKHHQQRLQKSGLSPECGDSSKTRGNDAVVTSAVSDGNKRERLSQAAHPTNSPKITKCIRNPLATQHHSHQLLQETRQVMIDEVQRMQATQQKLQQSSGVLEQTESSYNVFGARLSSATGIVQTLKKRSSTDSELLWAAFFFFVGCCTFVILRRAGLVKMALTVCLDAPQVF